MKKLVYIFLAILISGVSFDGYSAMAPKIRLRGKPVKVRRVPRHTLRPTPRPTPRPVLRTALKPAPRPVPRPVPWTAPRPVPRPVPKLRTPHSVPNLLVNQDFVQIVEAKDNFVTRTFNQYIQDDRTYSYLVNKLDSKLSLETKEDAVTYLLFHCLLEDWHTNGYLTGNLSEDFWTSITHSIEYNYLPEGRTITDIYAELVNKIVYDVERDIETSRHSRPSTTETEDLFLLHIEGIDYEYQNTSQDYSWSSQSKREKEQSILVKYRDVLDFIREFVDKLSDQLGGSSGSDDSSDDEDETESSDNTATSDTTHVQHQM